MLRAELLPHGLGSTGPWKSVCPWCGPSRGRPAPTWPCVKPWRQHRAVKGWTSGWAVGGAAGRSHCAQWDEWHLWVCCFQGTLARRVAHHCQCVRSGLRCLLRLLYAPPLIGMCVLQTQHTKAKRSCLLPASAYALESFSMQMSKYKTSISPRQARRIACCWAGNAFSRGVRLCLLQPWPHFAWEWSVFLPETLSACCLITDSSCAAEAFCPPLAALCKKQQPGSPDP